MANERLQGEERGGGGGGGGGGAPSHAKMRLKSAPQKLNVVMAKAISKSFAIDCGCKCP